MSGSLARPANTARGNNNNNNNIVSSDVSSSVPAVSQSAPVLLPSGSVIPTAASALSGGGSVSATAPLEGAASLDATVSLEATASASALMNGSVLPVPTMSMIVSESMASQDMSMAMSVGASASMSVVMEASTTPGGEVIPEPTTLPPVCTTDCAGKGEGWGRLREEERERLKGKIGGRWMVEWVMVGKNGQGRGKKVREDKEGDEAERKERGKK